MVLRELLERGKFQYLKVLNENADLTRGVTTVESTEAPDVARYIPQNTLLITTGMAFQNEPEKMCRFLEDLSECHCAAVAVKLGRFLDTLDERVIAAADALGLPLLQIPMDKTLGNVYHELLSFIWNNRNGHLLGALNAGQKISGLILQGSSLKNIIENVSMIFNKPAMVIDLFEEILAYGGSFGRGAREKAAQAAGELIGKKELEEAPYFIFMQGEVSYSMYPVKGVGRNTHYIIMPGFTPREKEEYLLIMEQVVVALEMYFYRELYVKYNEMKSKEEFMRLLLKQEDRDIWNEQLLLTVGAHYGLECISEYRVVFLEIKQEKNRKFNPVNFSKREERYILLFDWISQLLAAEHEILIFPQKSDWRYVCLVQNGKSDYLKAMLHIHDMVKEKFGLDMVIAQGGVVSSLLNTKNSYDQAEQSMTDGSRDKDFPYLLSYRPRNMKELFKFIPEREVRDTCRVTLRELAYPENQTEEELRKTLQTYLACGSCITKTAESLFVHRNTIKYRLKKCEEILGTDLSEEETRFQVKLALLLTEYAQ